MPPSSSPSTTKPLDNSNSNKKNKSLSSILLALSLNIFSSCGTIFINKYLFQNLNFKFGTLLTVMHFIFSHLMTQLLKGHLFVPAEISIKQILPISLAFCGYVVFNNLSLVFNSVSFYQVMKLLCTPTIIAIEYFIYQRKTDTRVAVSLIPVLIGVFITVFTDLDVNTVGTIFAIAAIGANSTYTVFGKVKQNELNANPMQILYLQSITSAIILSFCIPFFDNMTELVEFEWNLEVIVWIFFSCCTAFLVNFSFFLMVGKTSPLTANVVGYFKTCVVFVGGIVLFASAYTWKNVIGISVTLLGVAWYSTVKYQLDQEKKKNQEILPTKNDVSK